MISFKRFLLEKLTADQEREVSTWERDPEAIKHTDHFFGKGNDEVNEPLSGGHSEKSEPHKAVERHLKQEIDVDSYKKGLAKDQYGRQVKIGSLLAKSKAPQELVNGFANDSTRQLKRAEGLTVRVTRSPAGVAGQTSRGQSWEDQSCKNYETGSNKDYLKGEVKHGTVVAYLMHPNGTELARATLHPHHNDEGHVAYAVDSHYGVDHAEFKKHVDDLANRLSGEHKGGDIGYSIHPDVYNDSGVSVIGHPNLTEKHLSDSLNSFSARTRRVVARHPSANDQHISRALSDKDPSVRAAAASNKSASLDHINTAIDDEDSIVRAAAVKNPRAQGHHVDKALSDDNFYVRQSAFANPNVTSDHIERGLKDEDVDVRVSAIRHLRATPEQIFRGLDDDNYQVQMAAVTNPRASSEHLDKALKSKNPILRSLAISHPKATPEQIDRALSDQNKLVRRSAVSHPRATSDHINRGLDDADVSVRISAAKHPNATADHISRALDDKDSSVRAEAANHPNASKENIKKALKDPDDLVRTMASMSPYAQ